MVRMLSTLLYGSQQSWKFYRKNYIDIVNVVITVIKIILLLLFKPSLLLTLPKKYGIPIQFKSVDTLYNIINYTQERSNFDVI